MPRLPPETLRLLQSATNRSLMSFCKAMNDQYNINWHHELIAKALEDAYWKVKAGKRARIIIEVPPRHGKSELATINYPAWLLGKDPKMQTIVASYSEALAEDFGMKTRDIMQDERYKALFDTRLRTDSTAKGKWLTEQNGGYTATGIGGSITGRGFNIGIIDDPIKGIEEAKSQIVRDNIWNWYTSTFYTRQEGNGAIIVIATRWHFDDLIGRLLVKQAKDEHQGLTEYDQWEVIRLPAIAEVDEPPYRLAGEPLWPWKFTLPMLENIKNLDLQTWAALYQQAPMIAESQEFKKEYFKHFEPEDLKDKYLIYTTTVDLAISQNQTADNTVICTVAKEPDNPRWYVVEMTSGHLDPHQTIEAIFYHYNKYRSTVWIETVAYQKALKYFIEEEMGRRQTWFQLEELKLTKRRKEDRIRGLIPLFRTGLIFHRPQMVELEEEFLTFPYGIHDDHIDALAMQLEAVEPTGSKMPTRVNRTYSNLNAAI